MTFAKSDPGNGRPVGPAVDPKSAREPGAIKLIGRYGSVERLDASRHSADLWDAVQGYDDVWTYMSYGPFPDAATFSTWLVGREQLEDPFSYAVLDTHAHALGIATLREIRPAMRVIEIGHIVYSPELQHTPLATEAQYLLARYVFETLGYRRYEWRCNALNRRSYRAALRFGFTFEGVFRQDMIVKGRNRDTAWFAMLDHEWPRARAAFEKWLEPQNFDGGGRQRLRLEEIRNAL